MGIHAKRSPWGRKTTAPVNPCLRFMNGGYEGVVNGNRSRVQDVVHVNRSYAASPGPAPTAFRAATAPPPLPPSPAPPDAGLLAGPQGHRLI